MLLANERTVACSWDSVSKQHCFQFQNLQDGIQLEGRHDQRNSVLANSRLKPSLVYKNKFNIEMSAETDKSVSVTGSTINVRKTFVKGKQTKFESVSMLTPSTRTPNFNRTDPDLAGNNTHKVGTGRQEKTRNSSEAAESAEERDCGISLRSMDVKLEWMKIREEKKVIEEDRVMIQKQRKLLEQQQMELEQGKIKLACFHLRSVVTAGQNLLNVSQNVHLAVISSFPFVFLCASANAKRHDFLFTSHTFFSHTRVALVSSRRCARTSWECRDLLGQHTTLNLVLTVFCTSQSLHLGGCRIF